LAEIGGRWYNLLVTEHQTIPTESDLTEPEMAAVTPAAPPASTYERSLLLLVAATIIVVDHLTKLIIEGTLPLYQSWTPFEALPFVRITHVSNTGAAFGILPNASLFFMIMAIIVAAFILIYNFRLPANQRLLRLALGLQLGGAVGNLIDRFRLGHVTDFVDIGPLAVFNVADAAIVCGVVGLVLVMLLEERQRQAASQATADAAGDHHLSVSAKQQVTAE
jgi:signal peptidase II